MRRERGFTIFEMLIVVSIISVLLALTFTVASSVRRQEYEAQTRSELDLIAIALEEHNADRGVYPAREGGDANLDGRLFHALFVHERWNPKGTLHWDVSRLGVQDGETWRVAKLAEIADGVSRIAFLDQNGRPYHYRELASKPAVRWSRYELFAEGWNQIDEGGHRGDDLDRSR